MPFILQCWISNVAAAGSWGATFFHTDVGYPTLTAADGWGATSFIRTMLDIQPGSPRSNGAATAPFSSGRFATSIHTKLADCRAPPSLPVPLPRPNAEHFHGFQNPDWPRRAWADRC